MLNTLPRRGPKAFDSFVGALQETGNESVAETSGLSGDTHSSDPPKLISDKSDDVSSVEKAT